MKKPDNVIKTPLNLSHVLYIRINLYFSHKTLFNLWKQSDVGIFNRFSRYFYKFLGETTVDYITLARNADTL